MNTNEIISTILSTFPGSSLCRRSGATFIAVPGEVIDGVQTYSSIKVGSLLSKDTKTNKAFDLEAAQQEYAEFEAKQTEKANAPKKSTGADPVKQAAKQTRKDAMFLWLTENPGEHTCADIKAAMPEYADITIMQCGSDAKELWEAGLIDRRTEKSKNYYAAKE